VIWSHDQYLTSRKLSKEWSVCTNKMQYLWHKEERKSR